MGMDEGYYFPCLSTKGTGDEFLSTTGKNQVPPEQRNIKLTHGDGKALCSKHSLSHKTRAVDSQLVNTAASMDRQLQSPFRKPTDGCVPSLWLPYEKKYG